MGRSLLAAKWVCIAFVMGSALSACQVAPVARFDPYQGLMQPGQHPADAADHLPVVGQGRSLGLLISNSTERQFQYIKDSVKMVQTSPLLSVPDDFEGRVKPNYLVQQLLAKFKQHFARVTLVEDFNQATASHVDYIALVDLAVALPAVLDYSFTYDIKVDLLNPRIERIGSFAGFGHKSYNCYDSSCMNKAQVDAMDTALAQFGAAVDAGVK